MRLLLSAVVIVAAGLAACAGGPSAMDAAAAGACADLEVPGARCLTVPVPEDRSRPAGRTIQLRVLVLPATGTALAEDPVVFLAGGPGQAATVLARGHLRDSLRRERHLVFADQRGTGGSNDLRCEFYSVPPAGRFDDFIPAAKVRGCRDALEGRADLAQYTTAASVEDLEAVRLALGAPRLNIVGGSYGTRLAMEYVRAYEASVRTVVLEGAVPPTLSAPQDFGSTAQRALDAVLDECLADAACARAFPDIRREAREVFERLRQGPVSARVWGHTVEMTRDHVGEAVRYMLYSSAEAARLPLILHRAHQGDFSALGEFLANWRRDASFDALYLSITCAEDVPFVAAAAAARDESSFLGGYRVRQQSAACAHWPKGAAPAWRDEPVRSTTPVLILSGLLDPVTPPDRAVEIEAALPNSLHVRIPSGGHSPHGLAGLECLERLKTEFIRSGTVRGLDPSCAGRIRRNGFPVQ
jgi:pimeloyl-ACP methyl ester carboxylesterase